MSDTIGRQVVAPGQAPAPAPAPVPRPGAAGFRRSSSPPPSQWPQSSLRAWRRMHFIPWDWLMEECQPQPDVPTPHYTRGPTALGYRGATGGMKHEGLQGHRESTRNREKDAEGGREPKNPKEEARHTTGGDVGIPGASGAGDG
eukprot:scaffold803_cov310-Pinguiococcus_pyrenoidosus.AAC.145